MTFRKSLTAALMIGTALITFSNSAGWAQAQMDPRQSLPQRPSRAVVTPDYFGSMWGSLTPEQKFGVFIEAFWAFGGQHGAANCRPDDRRGIKACLAGYGYSFDVSYPTECKVTFTHHFPLPEQVEKSWDGRVVGNYPIGRRLTIDLRSLRKDMITNTLTVLFDERSVEKVRIETKLSSNPDEWLTIPNPPSLDDVQGGTEEERIRKFKTLRMQWGQQAAGKYGSGNLPYFSHWFPSFEMNLTPQQEVNAFRHVLYQLKPPNRKQPVSLFSPASSDNADALFVDALKSVIAKCPQQ